MTLRLRHLILGPLLLAALLGVNLAQAVIETYEFSDPALEERYKYLSAELRCPKCQNQNIADSNAPISKDLRKLLYKQLEEGASDEEILDFMVSRYGEFVRYKPRFSGATLILWFMPFILLGAALFLVLRIIRVGRGSSSESSISPEEQQKLDALLAPRADPQGNPEDNPESNT